MSILGKLSSALALMGCFAFAPLSAQTFLTWAANGSDDAVFTASPDGTGKTDRTGKLDNPWGIAYDGNHIYFTEDNANKVWRMNPDGSNRTLLNSAIYFPRDVHIANNQIYLAAGFNNIIRTNLDGSGATTLYSAGSFIQGIYANASYIYWTASADAVRRSDLDGSNVTDIANTGLNVPYGIWATDSHLYWTDLPDGRIERSNLDGSGRFDLITGLDKPLGLFVASDAIYFTQQYGTVSRVDLDGSNKIDLITGFVDARFIDGSIGGSAVPEPSTFAMFADLFALGFASQQRRRSGRSD